MTIGFFFIKGRTMHRDTVSQIKEVCKLLFNNFN